MICKKYVFGKFAKFTGKHLCQSLFFNKVADLRPATLLKKRLWHRCFPVNFAKYLRTPFLTEHLWSLLLMVLSKRLFILSTFNRSLFQSSHLIATFRRSKTGLNMTVFRISPQIYIFSF